MALWSDDPIITDIADLDVYKIRMLQYYWIHYRYSRGTYAFHNRKYSVRLADVIPIEALREELAHVATLRFHDRHIKHFRSLGGFREDFLDWLERDFRFSPIKVEKDAVNGQFTIEADGLLCEDTLWETHVMRVMMALYSRSKIISQGDLDAAMDAGNAALTAMFAAFRPRPRVKIMEFGTRRAAWPTWHRHAWERALAEAPDNFIGTSNVLFAMETGAPNMGTQAHALFMLEHARRRREVILRGWNNPDADTYVRAAQFEVFRRWYDLYGETLAIALIDTFGEDAFFEDVTDEFLHAWRGLRLDSGDPAKSAERAVACYRDAGVDPKAKLVVPSDGLNTRTILAFDDVFGGRIGTMYGLGTHFSNDLGPHTTALPIVMKLVAFEDFPTIKLSNNLAKAQGPEKEVKAAKRIYGYKRRETVACEV